VANAVEICNLGYANIGADANIVSIAPPDGSVEAGYAARYYPIARRILLSRFEWAFATKRVALAQVTNPSTVWKYAYARPADCLKPLRVIKSGAVKESDGADYEQEDGLILTDEPTAVLKYTRDVTDTTKYSDGFVSALSWLLSSYFVGPILKGNEGAKASASLLARAMDEGRSTSASDANQSSTVQNAANETLPTMLGVR